MAKERPRRSAPPAPLTPQRIREAVQHLLELAVAFEGGGVELVEAGSGDVGQVRSDPAALSCLTAVVEKLEAHRELQRDAQRKALAVALHTAAARSFAKFQGDPEGVDMEAEAREIAARYGLEAGDGLLDALMIAKQEIDGGPSNTAAQHIGDLLGVSSRMVFQHKSDKGAGPLWRSAWGRWVPSGLCTRYAVAACTPSEDEAVTVAELDRLDTLSDAAHRRLDAHVVNEYRRGVVEMLEMALFGDLDLVEDGAQKPELDEWRTRRAQLTAAVRAHVETRHANDAAEPREQGAIEKEIEAELRELARQMAERSLHEAGVSSGT